LLRCLRVKIFDLDSEENRASSYGPAKKASVSSTSTNIRKKSKFTHAYNDGNDTSESTVVGTKSKLISKFRNQTMPNEGPVLVGYERVIFISFRMEI